MISTLELYGVNPKELANMPYKDALKVKLEGLWGRKKSLADELYRCTDGISASRIQDNLRRVMKAIDLVELQIEEIKESP